MQVQATYLVRIRFVAVAASQDDGNGRRNDGVRSAHHGGEASPEEGLAQGVDAGDEEQRLDHPGFLLLKRRPYVDGLVFRHFKLGSDILDSEHVVGNW
jgi:hypothetical protein